VRLGLGIAAGSDPGQLAGLASEAEDLGYDSIWSNDNPAGDGLAQLSAWARDSAHIHLGVGVLALDRHRPEAIAATVADLQNLPGARIAVAAMGPRMCRLAGEVGDAVLLNWMTPERAAWARPLVAEGATQAGKRPGEVGVFGYVRSALGPGAGDRLAREVSMYLQVSHYSRHFEQMGAAPTSVGIVADDPSVVAAEVKRYTAMDEPVVRVLSHRATGDILAVARAAIGA